MTCGTRKFSNGNNEGLIKLHSYSLLAGYEINFKKTIIKLVQIRNPWGKGEWTGKWSDNCQNWNIISSEEKKKINYEKKPNDGIFFMEFNDFIKYFDDCQFCLINDDFKYNSIRVESTIKRAVFIKLIIEKKGKYFITVNLKSKRHYPESVNNIITI